MDKTEKYFIDLVKYHYNRENALEKERIANLGRLSPSKQRQLDFSVAFLAGRSYEYYFNVSPKGAERGRLACRRMLDVTKRKKTIIMF